MTPLKSSNLKAAGYDPASRMLKIEFHSGGMHQYHGVDSDTHQGLMTAESPGSYFHKHIKSKHTSSKVE